MLPFVPGHPALFVLRAFTKIHAMPGLRLGYALCSDAALLERIELARQPWSVSGVAQAAGLAGLGEKHRGQQARDYVAAERERLQRGLGRLGIAYVPSDANYILFHSPGPAGEKMAGQAPGADLFSLLLERGICIRDCQNFEGLSAGYYRIAVRKQEENDRLLQALGEIYGRVPAAQSSGFGEDGQWQNQS